MRGASRLVVEAATGVTDAVEAMHRTIQQRPAPLAEYAPGPTRGIAGLVYRAVRGGLKVTGRGIDAGLGAVLDRLPPGDSSPARDAVLAALNGVYGDYLAATDNELAISMQLRGDGGQPLAEIDQRPRIVVLAHGICMGDTQWTRHDHHHGRGLAAQLDATPIYLRYNSGLSVPENGRRFAELLEHELRVWAAPTARLDIVGFSMGGLVARSAWLHAVQAGMQWPERLRTYVSLGTPHLGAPMAKGGHWFDQIADMTPYAAPLGRMARRRSAGLHDLRLGTVVDDPDAVASLPAGVECFAIAGRLRAELAGDGLVSVNSALGRSTRPERTLDFPAGNSWVAEGAGHLDLLGRQDVFERLCEWMA